MEDLCHKIVKAFYSNGSQSTCGRRGAGKGRFKVVCEMTQADHFESLAWHG
jgi:hypothetical protein